MRVQKVPWKGTLGKEMQVYRQCPWHFHSIKKKSRGGGLCILGRNVLRGKWWVGWKAAVEWRRDCFQTGLQCNCYSEVLRLYVSVWSLCCVPLSPGLCVLVLTTDPSANCQSTLQSTPSVFQPSRPITCCPVTHILSLVQCVVAGEGGDYVCFCYGFLVMVFKLLPATFLFILDEFV